MTEQSEQTPLKEAIVFELNGVKYLYDYSLLTVEQIEIGTELTRWKEDQVYKGTNNLNDLFVSRGAEFLFIFLSYLVLEVGSDGIVKPYNFDLAQSKAYPFLKLLPGKYHQDLKKCSWDFFSNADLLQSGLTILEGKKRQKSIKERVLETVPTILAASLSNKNVL